MSVSVSVARERFTVRGIVQGVGFRPFVYGLARRCGLTGHVGNNSGGVFIEVEGDPSALEAFRVALRDQAPPLAYLESVTSETLTPTGDTTFVIVESEAQHDVTALIPPDLAICDDCLRELFDPTDRRYRYPFINCTNCGPRFTIIQHIPYDRPYTTMSGFPMCPACEAEYHDPADRRFHAQPVACPTCGPQVWYTTAAGETAQGEAGIAAARAALLRGEIVAVKGLGGFHIACDATNSAALSQLRQRKGRVDKPFAVMTRDLEGARRLAHVDSDEAALLIRRERPIVLVRKREGSELSPLVAPGNPSVGIMLAYTPLHHLLLEGDMPPLVMTSGNLSGEPIARDNDEALTRLAPLVDGFLLHDRPIHIHCDDSVTRVFEGRELPVRRSRGYTPFPVTLPFALAPVLAVGGELKNTFCITKARYAFISQHIGDMENLETLEAFTRAVAHFRALYNAAPEAVVCDLHPGYLASQWAARLAETEGLPLVQVQHHHAHIASGMAEHGLDGSEPVIGVCFDGTGYGTDGAIWGGEVLIADYAGFRRAAHLAYVPLPGGDAAVKRPYRVALAHLWAAGLTWDDTLPAVAACPPAERRVLERQLETGLNTVPTSSIGRLFDAVASLMGVRHVVTYEAQAAIEMEGAAEDDAAAYAFGLSHQNDVTLINPAPVLTAIVDDLRAGIGVGPIAARFHNAVATCMVDVCVALRETTGLNTVVLSGGVFQNIRLLHAALVRLRAEGFNTLTQRVVPANDGGLALGQAVIGSTSQRAK
jgi:hydrogenase maturation protein HypF